MSNKSKIVILGAGESGVGAAYLAQQQGYDVFVSDFGAIADKYKQQLQDWSIRFEESQHTEAEILKATEVIKSPGISDNAPIIKKIQEIGIPILSEIEFAGRYTDAKIIGIPYIKKWRLKCRAGRQHRQKFCLPGSYRKI
jgi:UDP-N-acetylmuramoylalanine--D-glutamate ligase